MEWSVDVVDYAFWTVIFSVVYSYIWRKFLNTPNRLVAYAKKINCLTKACEKNSIHEIVTLTKTVIKNTKSLTSSFFFFSTSLHKMRYFDTLEKILTTHV